MWTLPYHVMILQKNLKTWHHNKRMTTDNFQQYKRIGNIINKIKFQKVPRNAKYCMFKGIGEILALPKIYGHQGISKYLKWFVLWEKVTVERKRKMTNCGWAVSSSGQALTCWALIRTLLSMIGEYCLYLPIQI